ncbi:MAG: hypothetical protein PVJ27_07965 [Candidatus Brocadiaceae bacterium]|jgi:hypothetical protein
MPYIPPENRPAIDAVVDALADQIADKLEASGGTAEVSELYREAFLEMADFVTALERSGPEAPEATTPAQRVAEQVVAMAERYNQKGGWLGELNYAVTTLIQAVPFTLYSRGAWPEVLRYWLHAETVGALTRTAYDLHQRTGNDWIANGLAGVFEDVKDELKRRVNTAYEAAQIRKSGDCYDRMPFRTQLVPMQAGGVEGFIEIMLPRREPQEPTTR